MDQHLDTLEAILDKTTIVIDEIHLDEHQLATPCGAYSVGELLEHVALWVQVFESAVAGHPLDFDPSSHRVRRDWAAVFSTSAQSIMAALRADGYERPMTMTSDPIPGRFVFAMLLMEYLGHGWDLTRAVARPCPYADREAEVALDAARGIIEPQYRGDGAMFAVEVTVPEGAAAIERFVGFLGRSPDWAPPTTASN